MAKFCLPDPVVTILGPDPTHRSCVLNGNSFQQDAITSFNSWQYAVFYSSSSGGPPEPLYVHLARRKLPRGPWQILVFGDYRQTVDDSHNSAQLGLCHGDGTVHLSFDHHCDRYVPHLSHGPLHASKRRGLRLRYRVSVRGLATTPERFSWHPDLFTPTLDYLPGLPSTHKPFGYVTYPRFGVMGHDMFCSFRDGKAGLGDDHLYIYRAEAGHFSYVGKHLTGVQSNPYVHGIDYQNGRLHISWVYRAFVHYDGWDDPLDTKHKQQAGPNSAANNHNICYAFSDDKGYTWKNAGGKVVASLERGETVTNYSDGIVAVEIPKRSGLSNQESQAVDLTGGMHILNRGRTSEGAYVWKHYYRPSEGTWHGSLAFPVPPGLIPPLTKPKANGKSELSVLSVATTGGNLQLVPAASCLSSCPTLQPTQ